MNNTPIIIQLISGKNGSTVFKDLESILYSLGFVFSIEMVYLTINLAISVVGIILNIFSVIIFLRPAFYSANSPPLFAYLRYEAIIGVLGNIIGAVYGIILCPDTIPLVNNYPSQFIEAFIAVPVYNITYYAKFLVEIMIVVDRIIILAPSFSSRFGLNKLHKIKRTWLVFLVIWIFSFMINYPYIYLLNAPSVNTLINYGYPGYQVYTINAYSRNSWSSVDNPGYYPMLFIYIFKNCFTFGFETVLNIISLILFQRHLAQKTKLTGPKMSVVNRPKEGGRRSTAHVFTTSRITHQTAELEDPAGEGGRSAGGRKMANLVLVTSVTGFIHNVLLTTYTMYYLNFPKVSLTLRV
jgi:hypothetical protein